MPPRTPITAANTIAESTLPIRCPALAPPWVMHLQQCEHADDAQYVSQRGLQNEHVGYVCLAELQGQEMSEKHHQSDESIVVDICTSV